MFKRLVDPAPEEGPALREEYRRRKRKLYLMAVGWMLYGMLVLWTPLFDFDFVPLLLLGGIAVFGLLSLWIWRCPRCGTPFGRRWWVDVCPGCRLVLEEDEPAAERAGASVRQSE